MKKKINEIEKLVDHPLEDIFDIEPCSTTIIENEIETELNDHDAYDDKDAEIEQQFQEIHNVAMTAFEQQQEQMRDIDPKFRARNQEVSVQYLNAALNAVKEKANLKKTKDKLVTSQESASTVNNNLIIDHNSLMKQILGHTEEGDN